MAAVIETVSIEDVYPLYDEYGICMASRDYTTKENQAYVDELARSMRAKGVPDEMVTLVRDGGIYRIKAGNSRVMAMRKLGTKAFPAIVEDETPEQAIEQAIVETVVRTNTKKKYEPQEESRFVRQLAMFGDDDYVAEVSGIEAAKVAKVRRASRVVRDAADDMSLLRLITIAEFADDPEAVEELTNCSERDYQIVARNLEYRRKKEREAQAVAEELQARNIPVVDSMKGYRLIANVNSPDMIPEDLPEGCAAMSHATVGFFLLLRPLTDDEQAESDAEAKGMAEAQAVAALYEEGTAKRRKWLAGQLAAQSMLPALSRLVAEADDRHGYRVERFLKATDTKRLNVGHSEIVNRFEALNGSGGSGILDRLGRPRTWACESYTALLDAMEADGYEPDEDERDIYRRAKEHLDGTEGSDE